jgi:hypothetical protein
MPQHEKRGMINWRPQRSRIWTIACCTCIFLGLLLLIQPASLLPLPFHSAPPPEPPPPVYHSESPQILQYPAQSLGPCRGPRGSDLQHPASEDTIHPVLDLPNVTYPQPTYGSYKELALEQSWMTFSQRYGPYGQGEDDDSFNATKVDWASVKWGQLQDQCLHSKQDTFTSQSGAPPRFRFYGDGELQVNRSEIGSTGRQAIVLRTWSTYDYKPEDYWNLRSIITEAALATDGEYTVYLLVDVKHPNASRIHEDDEFYHQMLIESVPAEFRDMAVLFHKSLQESWYAKVQEFRPIWQIMQPLQLFAHFYPEFDHYWQFEMDTRFTGHAGKMLREFHKFGTQVPYKQSRERASWTYMEQIHGTYSEFSTKVNDALGGNATVWGPVSIVDVPEPLGRIPPMNASDDNFNFGVGWEADLTLLSPLFEVKRFKKYEDWVFKDWIRGFNDFSWHVPRFSNAPAQARASRSLLEAIHNAQHEKGLRVAAEATLPSFAMWHGMKVVQMPMPNFQFPERDINELNIIHNGGAISKFKDGIANGAAPYQKSVIEFYSRPRTWEWQSSLIKPMFDHWMGIEKNEKTTRQVAAALGYVPDVMPPFMAEVDGEVYCPNLLLHPRKTNPPP